MVDITRRGSGRNATTRAVTFLDAVAARRRGAGLAS
jgi:hypothetical protein